MIRKHKFACNHSSGRQLLGTVVSFKIKHLKWCSYLGSKQIQATDVGGEQWEWSSDFQRWGAHLPGSTMGPARSFGRGNAREQPATTKKSWNGSNTSKGRKFRKRSLETNSPLCDHDNAKIPTHLLLRIITSSICIILESLQSASMGCYLMDFIWA